MKFFSTQSFLIRKQRLPIFMFLLMWGFVITSCGGDSNQTNDTRAQNKDKVLVLCAEKNRVSGIYVLDIGDAIKQPTFIVDARFMGRLYAFNQPPPITVSPSGQYLAYYDRDETVYLVDLKTQKRTELTSIAMDLYLTIIWSPDGEQVSVGWEEQVTLGLAFSDKPLTVATNWAVFDLNGSLVKSEEYPLFSSPFWNFEEDGPLLVQSVSPDKKLMVSYNEDNNIMISRTNNFSKLWNKPIEIIGDYRFIEWSPDSEQLLLWTTESHKWTPSDELEWGMLSRMLTHGSKSTLFVVNADGTDLKQISDVGEVNTYFYPTWSPDGKSIIYGSWLKDTNGDGIAEQTLTYDSLIMVTQDGSNKRELLDETYNITCVDW